MAVTAFVYTRYAKSLYSKLLNQTSDTLKVALLAAYTPSQYTHQFWADVLAAGTEASGTGYTTGGLMLSGVSFTQSANQIVFSAANPVWSGSTITASFAVFYDSQPGSSATDPLICYWDFGGPVSSASTPFTLFINSSGIATFTT